MIRNWLLAALCLGLTAFGAAAQESSPAEIARAQFTTGVADREPIDAVDRLGSDAKTVFFFTELLGFKGQQVVHRWEHDGEVIADVSFDVNGPRWRVWSTKTLLPEWQGEWTVSVVNGGQVLRTETFTYGEAESPVETAAADSEAGAPGETADAGIEAEAATGPEDASPTDDGAPADAAPASESVQQDASSQ